MTYCYFRGLLSNKLCVCVSVRYGEKIKQNDQIYLAGQVLFAAGHQLPTATVV